MLEDLVAHRSLHRDWAYQGLDGAMAARALGALGEFLKLIDALTSGIQGIELHEQVEQAVQAGGLIEHYKKEKGERGQARIENLEELVNAAESFVTQEGFGKDAVALPVDEQGAAAGGAPAVPNATTGVVPPPDAETGEIMSPLAAFLTHASLEAGDNQAQAGQDAIQLMTVHSAKGLEFDAVFITGIEEGLFPHEQSLADADGVEEERRLMYVAITRARKRLYLSFSQTRLLHGQTRYNVKSRFFDELPEACLKWITPRNQDCSTGEKDSHSETIRSSTWQMLWANATFTSGRC